MEIETGMIGGLQKSNADLLGDVAAMRKEGFGILTGNEHGSLDSGDSLWRGGGYRGGGRGEGGFEACVRFTGSCLLAMLDEREISNSPWVCCCW